MHGAAPAPQPICSRHRTLAGRTNLAQFQRPVATPHEWAPIANLDHAGEKVGVTVISEVGPLDHDDFAIEQRPCTRLRRHGPHMAIHQPRGPAPVDPRLLSTDLGGIGDAVTFLRDQAQLYRQDAGIQRALARAYAEQGKKALQHMSLAEYYALSGALPAALEQLRIARSSPDASFYDQAVIDARERELQSVWRDVMKQQGKR